MAHIWTDNHEPGFLLRIFMVNKNDGFSYRVAHRQDKGTKLSVSSILSQKLLSSRCNQTPWISLKCMKTENEETPLERKPKWETILLPNNGISPNYSSGMDKWIELTYDIKLMLSLMIYKEYYVFYILKVKQLSQLNIQFIYLTYQNNKQKIVCW